MVWKVLKAEGLAEARISKVNVWNEHMDATVSHRTHGKAEGEQLAALVSPGESL